jgi:glucose/arabinose dehydrogenase
LIASDLEEPTISPHQFKSLRMKKLATLFSFTCLFLLQFNAQVSLVNFATGFTRPCDITHCGDDRLFVVEQGGKIWILDKNGVKLPTPFLDIDPKVGSSGNEQGLLGLAFHPNYAQNGYFYVNYTDNSGDTKISRFSVSATNPNVSSTNSELILLMVDQPYSNHNGGCLKFGPDGYLYIGLGDGGSGGDPQNYGQNKNSLLGKMLRIDVNSGAPYAVPVSNPFVNDPTTLDEIWAIGLRNPWRFSFDRTTGDLWIGDVGQDAWEEVDFQPANSPGGQNYGWRCYEGTHPFNTNNCPGVNTLTMPVAEYSNSGPVGCSITGGFVYRGFTFPQLYGRYLYTDYCTGRLWAVVPNGMGGWTNTQLADLVNFQLVSFGENRNGELFLLGLGNGTVYRLRDATEEWTFQIVATPSVCSNSNSGSIQINFSPNTLTPTVAWSDGGSGASRSNLANGSYTATITGTNGAEVVETILLQSAQTASLSSSTTDVSCPGIADGSIDLNLDGTNEPPTAVVWSDGGTGLDRSGLPAGNYAVTVTSAEGCVFEETFLLNVTNPVSLSSTITDVNCLGDADGSISLVLEGSGGAPASVEWSDGNTDLNRINLAAGQYDVTITSVEGCVVEESFEIVNLYHVFLTSTVTDVLCPGAATGSIDLTLEGTNNPPSAVIWSDGNTDLDRMDLEAGQYSVTVTSQEGCVVEESFEVAAAADISLNSSITDVPCVEAANGSISLTLNGSNVASVAWNDGVTELNRTGLAAGEYSVTVTSEDICVFEETYSIAVDNSISLTSNVQQIPCSNANDGSIELALTGTTAPPTSVFWSDGNNDLHRTGLAAGQYSVTVTAEEGCVFEANFDITVGAILSLTGNVADVPCAEAANGSIELVLEGSTAASVVWSDGNTDLTRTGLAAGQYSVTVTTVEACVLEETFEIEVLNNITLTGTATNLPCAEAMNGSIDMNLVGSDALDATFIWSDGSMDFDRTGLAAGQYNVTLTTSEGCVLEELFQISDLNSVSLTGIATNVPCAEATIGSIILSLEGSNISNASAIWSDGSMELDRMSLAAGQYSVTVTTSEGCVLEATFEVVSTDLISLNGTVTNVLCVGGADGSIDLTLEGTNVPPAAVSWSNGSTSFDLVDLPGGEYSVTVTSAEGCVFKDTFEVSEPVFTTPPFIIEVAINELQIEDIWGSYQWLLNGVPIPGATEPIYTVTQSGVYSVEVSGGGCSYVSNELSLIIDAVRSIQALQSVTVTPNPFSQHIWVELAVNEPVRLDILLRDLQGKAIFTEQVDVSNTTQHLLELGHLPSGTYFLVLRNDKGEWVEKIVK